MHVPEHVGVGSPAPSTRLLLVWILAKIVLATQLLIAQHLVRPRDLLELLVGRLGVLLVLGGVLVWVVLHCKPVVCALNLALACRTTHIEHLVVVDLRRAPLQLVHELNALTRLARVLVELEHCLVLLERLVELLSEGVRLCHVHARRGAGTIELLVLRARGERLLRLLECRVALAQVGVELGAIHSGGRHGESILEVLERRLGVLALLELHLAPALDRLGQLRLRLSHRLLKLLQLLVVRLRLLVVGVQPQRFAVVPQRKLDVAYDVELLPTPEELL
mmetsp:Transcript_22678/g.58350  ORF Transcript_22678/g.58350 Transcript_22678/m.58350 type:complete len:278 (+) Transcript_22678:169-1002(+)